ncbi:HTH-type transcriptional repressor NagR [Anaerolineae bacterium]|nr:HTH-type transcriptional repressor NagR [Anaerolineae bacterium]
MSIPRFTPYYRWLGEILREDISQGVYKPGDALPTEHELIRRYNLSSTTVRRAVRDLVLEGWIYRKAGKGTFVKRDKLEERLARLTSFAEEMQNRNITPKFKLIAAEQVVPPHDVARALKLSPQQKVFLIERIQIANGEPIALARGYWDAVIGEKLAQLDLHRISLYEIIEQHLHIPLAEADESISAAVADADIARKLGVRKNSPLLVRRRLTYTSEMRPIEHTTTFYRADQYEYKIRLSRHTT